MTGETKFWRCQQPMVAIGKKILLGIFLCVLSVGGAFAALSDADFLKLCQTGTLQQVEEAIKSGANVNAKDEDDFTALMSAAMINTNSEVIIALINAGADINAKTQSGLKAIDFTHGNKNIENTEAYRLLEEALFIAMPDDEFLNLCLLGTPQQVERAIKGGANVNAKDKYGETPLTMVAGLKPNLEIITMLIKAGADVNARGELTGWTVLMLAALKASNPEVITALINAGADIYARNKDGGRAIDYAKENENIVGTDVYRLLQAASK